MGRFRENAARPRLDWRGNPMTMVKWLIVANIVAFLPQTYFRISGSFTDIQWFGLSWHGLASWHLWQPLTYVFEHDNIWSLIFFLVALWFLGRDLEYYIGARALLKLYALSVFAAAVCYLALSLALGRPEPLYGSQAPFLAILAAYAILWPDRPLMFEVTAKWWAIIFIAVTTWFLLVPPRGLVYLAHLGGLVAGYLVVKVGGYSPEPAWLGGLQSAVRKLRPQQAVPRRTSALALDKEKELPKEDFISKEVDPILDKISQQGIQSLTERERRILDKARRKMEDRKD